MAQVDVKPEPGDLIEILHGSYQHWGVYVGDGDVVHVVPPSEISGVDSCTMTAALADKAVVKKERLYDMVGGDKWKINNSLDKKYKSRDAGVIVKEAGAQVGKVLPYSVIGRNCEHFVSELRYGKPESLQVQKAAEVSLVAGAATATVGAMAMFALFGGSKKEDRNKY